MEKIGATYLQSIKGIFKMYSKLATAAVERMDDSTINLKPSEDSNSISIIASHIGGNMISRWTDFLTTDGEKEFRNRDQEFEKEFITKGELLEYMNKGWSTLFSALEQLTQEDLGKTVYIRNEPHTVVEAINRQLGHIPYHVGQMIFISKMYHAEPEWKSLSIEKGKSAEFNKKKFDE